MQKNPDLKKNTFHYLQVKARSSPHVYSKTSTEEVHYTCYIYRGTVFLFHAKLMCWVALCKATMLLNN